MNTTQIIILLVFAISFVTMLLKIFKERKPDVTGGGEKDPEPKETPDKDEKIF
jgi:hypothetical protein